MALFWKSVSPQRGLLAVAMFCLLCGWAQAKAEALGPSGINVHPLHEQGLSGKDIQIGMLSSGNALATHEAFFISDSECAVINYDFTGKGIAPASHDTQVAGIVVSQGSKQHPNCRGIATGSQLHSARISDGSLTIAMVDRALHELIVNKNCRIIVTGIQLPSHVVPPNGSSPWAKMYDYYAEHYDVLFANAAGNSDSVITIFGDGFNGVTTGGLILDETDHYRIVGSISNPGPTKDGRRKPELMAPAQKLMIPNASGNAAWSEAGTAYGQTSFATPHTAGVAALLMERAAQTSDLADNKTLAVKAILVNSADPNLLDKSSLPTNPDETVWHPQRGYGRLDAARALKLLEAGRIRPGTPISATAGWAIETLKGYDRHLYSINARKNQRLMVTLTWHRKLTRLSATSYSEEMPRLNLLLEIKSPKGETLFSESDFKNNLRKTSLLLDADGPYQVIVQNRSYQKDRPYAIAVELISF